MYLHWIDWTIVGGLVLGLVVLLLYCQQYVRNTADFLAANRCAGRYILAIASGIGGLGAISIIAVFEMSYSAGFTSTWWGMLSGPIGLVIAISGWVYYRRRETRTLTLAQFFEVRYSRNFRVYAGVLTWLSGIVNYGIFPAVGARFFLYFCGFPEYFQWMGVHWDTYAILLTIFIGAGAAFACFGGQIAIMVTDFAQGMFCNIAFLILIIFFFYKYDMSLLFSTMLETAPKGASMINPFDTAANENFSPVYFVVGIVGTFYNAGAWQGSMGYFVAAKTPHEAKMSTLLGTWRGLIQGVLFMVIPVCAYMIMKNGVYADTAAVVNSELAAVGSVQLQTQLTVPMVLRSVLPVGLIGVFAAVMFSAMLSTDNTYMHSWGSIFIQDIIMPFRKTSLDPKKHIRLLRLSIVGVGIFGWVFSYFFRQTQYIMMFFALTGAIWLGGAGAVIIGGLYWKKGTTLAAWLALSTGLVIAVGGMLFDQFPDLRFMDFMTNDKGKFFLNGQMIYFWAMVISCSIYIITSLLQSLITKHDFNLDKMLHRGKYDISHEHINAEKNVNKYLKVLGMTKEFTLGDKILFFANIAWSLGWFAAFIGITVAQSSGYFENAQWITFWQIWLWAGFFLGVGTTIWFLWGGIRDIGDLFYQLKHKQTSNEDDGRVVNGQNAGEIAIPQDAE